jgi:GNAT superfamily N-acetyltransferase
MRIERLGEGNLADVYCCLGERKELYRDEIDESVGYLGKKFRLGWLAYALYDDSGRPIGKAILVPSSDPLSPVEGHGLYYFHCLDVEKDSRNQGLGKELLEKVEQDVLSLGGKGLAVDCYGDYWMPCSFFAKFGFRTVKSFSEHSLLVKGMAGSAHGEFVEAPYSGDLPESGIQVDIQYWSTCPYMLKNYRDARELVKKIEPEAVIRERMIDTREDVERWGGSGFYVNGKPVSAGPVGEEELKEAISSAKR